MSMTVEQGDKLIRKVAALEATNDNLARFVDAIHKALEDNHIVVNVPTVPPPDVVVNVPPANVEVHLPKQETPNVEVNVPEQVPAPITVEARKPVSYRAKITAWDDQGRETEMILSPFTPLT